MSLSPLGGSSMPMWLAAALRLLVGSPFRAVGTGALAATAAQAAGLGPGSLGIPGVDLFPDGKTKRRRRRRALTASDRADIGFLTGLLGPTAAKQLATVIITRSAS